MLKLTFYFSDYNQSINSPEACRSRLLKYLIPVLIISIGFNVPKFLEAKVAYSHNNGTWLKLIN